MTRPWTTGVGSTAVRISAAITSIMLTAALAAGVVRAAETKKSPNSAADNTTAQRLVDEARQAELASDTARQFSLLRRAVRVAPDFELARWQLGQMQVNGEWVPIEEAERAAAANPKQAEYAELRKQYGESPAGQLALARWCRKNGLVQEAEFHWQSVLAVEPRNEEALRALGMTLRNGRPVTQSQLSAVKEEARRAKQAAKRWSTTISKWRRALDGSDQAARDAALLEIRTLKDIDAIAALEAVTLGRDAFDKHDADEVRQISLAFVGALAKLSFQASTQSLVRHAVFSPSPDVRSAATETLKGRPLHEFVPMLLDALAMPIESSFHFDTNPDGSVHYYHSLYREGPETDASYDLRLSAMQHNLGGRWHLRNVKTGRMEIGPPTESEATLAPRKAAVVAQTQSRYGSTAAATELSVWNANRATEQLNAAIIAVLTTVSGLELGDTPRAWWDWWREQNEYYAADDRPVDRRYYSGAKSYFYGEPRYSSYDPSYSPALDNKRYVQTGPVQYVPIARSRAEHMQYLRSIRSCFPKGTLVWTKTGHRPIESLELGELVLAQNVDTGELTYKPVIGRTVRPPSPILKIALQRESLNTTKGHPLWVAGVGWRMAKELGYGAILHSVSGGVRIEGIEELDKAEAYNLIVADFNTYFVGQSGVLVHDNTPRRPTEATVPGLAAKSR